MGRSQVPRQTLRRGPRPRRDRGDRARRIVEVVVGRGGGQALYMPAIVGSALLGLGPGLLAVLASAFAYWLLWSGGSPSDGGMAEFALFGASSL